MSGACLLAKRKALADNDDDYNLHELAKQASCSDVRRYVYVHNKKYIVSAR